MEHQSSTKIEATVFDPAPPAPLFTAIGVMLAATALLSLLVTGPTPLLALCLALIFAYDLRPRRRMKKTRLTCSAGYVRVPGRGLIRTRDVDGATTARVGDRVAIALSHRRRRRTPIILDLPDEAALATVCKSLGIGHNGFGQIDFITEPTGVERARYVTNAIAFATLALALVPELVAVGGVAALVVAIAAVLALVRVTNPPPVARLTSAGVFVPLRTGNTFLPFHLIEEVALRPGEILFRVRTDKEALVHVVRVGTSKWSRRACSAAELEHLVAQIRAAVDRAHGKFVFKPEPTLAAQLKRGEHESIAEWHARIDTIGVGAAGYRATALDAVELWSLFEDPEAEADARAGAARILARLDRKALRVRVADVLATVRDDAVRARISESIEENEGEDERDERSAAGPLL
jgi:hypothetical protein